VEVAFNRFVASLLQSRLHPILSGNTLLLRYRGRRSGQLIHLPVNYLRVETGRLLLTSRRERVWWRNFEGSYPVEVVLRGVRLLGEAKSVEDPAAIAEGLDKILQARPAWARGFGVGRDSNGSMNAGDLGQAAMDRVLVVIELLSEASAPS